MGGGTQEGGIPQALHLCRCVVVSSCGLPVTKILPRFSRKILGRGDMGV